MTDRINKALETLKEQFSFSSVLDKYDGGNFVEFTVNRYGDICQFRVYNNGTITEK